MEIRKLEQMFEVLRSKPKKRLVAAYANDDHTICAVNAAVKEGLIEATLLGDENVIAGVCKAEGIDMANFKVINERRHPDEGSAPHRQVHARHPQQGTRPLPAQRDAGPRCCHREPQLSQAARSLRLRHHPVARHQTETTVAEVCYHRFEGFRHQLPEGRHCDCYRTDERWHPRLRRCCLVFPNLEASNVFYKCCTKFDKSEVGAMLMGAKVPCVLSSRGDTSKTKLYSIALAAMLA